MINDYENLTWPEKLVISSAQRYTKKVLARGYVMGVVQRPIIF
ncbi:MAG: hypothetical protein ABTQ25_15380 [Nitrosomonas ureae]